MVTSGGTTVQFLVSPMSICGRMLVEAGLRSTSPPLLNSRSGEAYQATFCERQTVRYFNLVTRPASCENSCPCYCHMARLAGNATMLQRTGSSLPCNLAMQPKSNRSARYGTPHVEAQSQDGLDLPQSKECYARMPGRRWKKSPKYLLACQ